MLNDAGTHEVNATTGEDVDTNGTGLLFIQILADPMKW